MTAAETETIREQILERYASFARALAEGDAAGVAAHYSADAVILAPGGVPVVGGEAIAAYWEGLCAMPYHFEVAGFSVEHLLIAGPYVIEVSCFSGKTHDSDRGSFEYRAKNLVVWQHDGSRWLIVRDAYNDIRS